MTSDARSDPPIGHASQPVSPGASIRIGNDTLMVDIAPAAGGRLAQITHAGTAWLLGHDPAHAAMIAWGCYPMLPWAGRLRHGRFTFDRQDYRLARNFDEHAIHGIGFALPWRVEEHAAGHAVLALQLPENAHWPFGGVARQRIEVESAGRLRLRLSVTAGARAMPVAIGWHPWFRKPDAVRFSPTRMYLRDAQGIATGPPVRPVPGPWDDCFINHDPVELQRAGQQLRLTSDCDHWVVYDEPAQASCFEPQTGPPDAFNLAPVRLAAGETRSAWFLMEWL